VAAVLQWSILERRFRRVLDPPTVGARSLGHGQHGRTPTIFDSSGGRGARQTTDRPSLSPRDTFARLRYGCGAKAVAACRLSDCFRPLDRCRTPRVLSRLSLCREKRPTSPRRLLSPRGCVRRLTDFDRRGGTLRDDRLSVTQVTSTSRTNALSLRTRTPYCGALRARLALSNEATTAGGSLY
jgi:hypothetical protein